MLCGWFVAAGFVCEVVLGVLVMVFAIVGYCVWLCLFCVLGGVWVTAGVWFLWVIVWFDYEVVGGLGVCW